MKILKSLCDVCLMANANCPVYPIETHACKPFIPDIAKLRVITKSYIQDKLREEIRNELTKP